MSDLELNIKINIYRKMIMPRKLDHANNCGKVKLKDNKENKLPFQ